MSKSKLMKFNEIEQIICRSDDTVAYVKNHGFEKIAFKDLTLYHIVPDQNMSKVLM